MNRAKKFKIHKKKKVETLQDEVKRIKNELWMTKFDRDSVIVRNMVDFWLLFVDKS